MAEDNRLAYRVPEFAKLVGISRAGAYLAVQRGEIPSVRLGRVVLIPVEAVREFLSNVRKDR